MPETTTTTAGDAPPPADPNTPPSGDSPNAPPPEPAAPPPPPTEIVIGGDMLERLRAAAGRASLSVEKYLDHMLTSGGPKREPVPFEPTNVDDMYRYARMLAGASLLPRAYYDRDDKERKHPRIADVHFVLCKGQALGLHPTVSISTINIIDGKAEIGAQLMVGLCIKSGLCEYFEPGHSDEKSATFVTKRRGGSGREISFTYTIEEADQMGLLDKGKSDWAKENNQWRKQPRTMLRRRCQSMLAREVYPDIVMGLYDHDEIADLRERERALGVDPDRVIQVDGARAAGDVSDGVPVVPPRAALAEPSERVDLRKRIPDHVREERDREGPRETVPVRKADPLKERLRSRAVEAQPSLLDRDGAPVLGPGEVACAGCQVPILGKKGDRCAACKDS